MTGEVIGLKDPNHFRSQEFILKREGGGLNVVPVGPELTFAQMSEKRVGVDPEEMWRNVNGVGQRIANLGVAGIITAGIKGETYLIGLKHFRAESGDSVWNHVGGYVEARHHLDLRCAIEEEIAEEFLPVTGDGKLIRFSRDGRTLPKPYTHYFKDCDESFTLTWGAHFGHPYAIHPLFFNGKPLEGEPKVHLEPIKNTAKVIYGFHLTYKGGDLPVEERGLSFHSSNERFNGEKGELEVLLKPHDIILVRLCGGRLTKDFFNVKDGQLVPIDTESLYLGETFDVDPRGIARGDKMELAKYL